MGGPGSGPQGGGGHSEAHQAIRAAISGKGKETQAQFNTRMNSQLNAKMAENTAKTPGAMAKPPNRAPGGSRETSKTARGRNMKGR